MSKSVAIFGAGIAGLSAAHEFMRLGYTVVVYEATEEAGGFFRSGRLPENANMPSEYSWHGFGPWYHNVFDVMKQIPFDKTDSVYDKALSRPINFGIAPDKGNTQFNDTRALPVSRMLRMRGVDSLRWGWLLLKTWASNRRTCEYYAGINAAHAYKPILSHLGWQTWKATFGPWVGSDWTHVSLHTMGSFYRKLLMSKPSHDHQADTQGPAWSHSQGDGWLLLRGPSSEYWFDKWVAHLENNNVRFLWNQGVKQFNYNGERITKAILTTGEAVHADYYVMATTPFAAADVFRRTPELAKQDQCCLFEQLIQDGPHTQVSFRIAFSEEIAWPGKRMAVIIADSEYNITICPEDQVWDAEVYLGDGVKALWTGTACVQKVPGPVYGIPVVRCTKDQFIEEIREQLFRCDGLDNLIKEANDGRSLKSFPIVTIEVWHEWDFSESGIKPRQPKWVTTTNTQPFQPEQATPVPNLVLAGAHTRTQADVWSIEGAVESGRRAAKAIDPKVEVLPQYKDSRLRMISQWDDALFSIGAPHILDVGMIIFLIIVVMTAVIMVID